MTTRLTIEVQRIPFANIEPFCAFLAEHGLETGGTGPKVRPRRRLQGHDLPVRSDRHGRVLAYHPRALLEGLARRQAAAQVQDRRRRLPEQLRQARPERPRRYRPARAVARPFQMPRLQGLPDRKGLPHRRKPSGRGQTRLERGDVQPLRTLCRQVPVRRCRRGKVRLCGLYRRPLGQAHRTGLGCSRTYSRARRKCSRSSSVPSPCSATRATPVSVSDTVSRLGFENVQNRLLGR